MNTHEWHQHKIVENIDSYLGLLLGALEKKASRHPAYTLSLYPAEQIQTAYFGERSDGASWSFTVYGHDEEPEYDPAYHFSHKQFCYTIQKFHLRLQAYTLFQQETQCSCGNYKIHTAICLPEKLSRKCCTIIKIRNTLHRRALLENFASEMLVYLTFESRPLKNSLIRNTYAI